MKESEFLGTLLPSHPNFFPIVQSIREKYNLPEISPDDEAIKEIFLGEKIIPLEEFRKEIENCVRENLTFLPPELLKIYIPAKAFSEIKYDSEIESYPPELQKQMMIVLKFAKTLMDTIVQIIDPMIDAIVHMLYTYLLLGETEEVPNDWIGKVITLKSMVEPMVMAMAGKLSNPDVIVQQFREEYKKTFGIHQPKITSTAVSSAYYLQLQKAGKPWDYIVEEYIRLDKLSLPKNRNTKRYTDVRRKIEQKLKKRMQRAEIVLQAIVRDKKQ
jgi:hypothetical protein